MKTSHRLIFLSAVFFLAVLALVINVSYLAVTGKHLISGQDIRKSSYATGRGTEEKILYAHRGSIYSSDNELLASSVTSYKLIVYLSPTRTAYEEIETDEILLDKDGNEILDENGHPKHKKINTEVPRHVTDPALYAAQLSPIIGMDEEKLREKLDLNSYDVEPKKKPYQIELGAYGSNLTYAQKTKIEALRLPGLEFDEVIQRNHKFGSLAAHVLGYTSQDESDISKMVGVYGVELSFDKMLSGIDGLETSVIDSQGYTLPDGITSKIPAVNGDDVYLTINTSVQREAEVYMEQLIERDEINYAWAMVMEAQTGKILCMVSYPSYDLNVLENTTLNYNLQYPYECGSVVKPFVYATAMDDGVYPENETYLSGNFNIYGRQVVNDWYRPGWGYVGYDEGLVRSSNVAICNLVTRFINEDHLRENYKKLGYWQGFNLDGLDVYSGTNHLDKSDPMYSPVDYVMTGFGQSATWTSFHLLRAYSVFANDGCIVEPYLVDYVLDGNTNEIVYKASTKKSEQIFTPETCARIRGILVDVVNDMVKGTAAQYRMDDVIFAGKSGTGQIYDQVLGYESGQFNYTIAGLAPAEDPKIVLVCGVQGSVNVHHGLFAEMVMDLVRTSLNTVHGYDNIISESGSIEYTMENFTNHTVDYAKNVLQNAGIKPIVIGDGGSVIGQYPSYDTSITKTSHIFILTDGNNISMPNFTGWTRKEISTFASIANITVNFDGSGKALEQSVPSGAPIEPNIQILVRLG